MTVAAASNKLLWFYKKYDNAANTTLIKNVILSQSLDKNIQ